MSVHKDKKTGKWFVSCRYDNWDGARKQKVKRGFETKREALSWEREFLQIKNRNLWQTPPFKEIKNNKDYKIIYEKFSIKTTLCQTNTYWNQTHIRLKYY